MRLAVNFESLTMQSTIDLANTMEELMGRYRLEFILSPELMVKEINEIDELEWSSIPHGLTHVDQLPDQRGIYAFVISQNNSVLPNNGYVVYVGIAGRKSERTLKQRYKDYLNEKSVNKRARIARMIGLWHSVLHFCYVPVPADFSSEQLEALEEKINDALLPPFSRGDLSGEVRQVRSAF